MKKSIRSARTIAGLAAVAAAVGAVGSAKAQQVNISISGSTAMRNFTTNPGFTLLDPGSTITLSNGTFGSGYWASGSNTLLQLAPDVKGVSVTGTGADQVPAVNVIWHEQGSVEGILDMVNDQIGVVAGNAGTRDASSPNPIWVSRNKFTAPNSSANGYTIGTGQPAVQMAISDVNAVQGFSTAGTPAWNKTVGTAGYGKGNSALPAPSAGNLSGLGVAGQGVQLVSSSVLNMSGILANGVNAGTTGSWTNAGTANLENNKVAVTATLFVANPGTGLDKLNRTDAQFLQTTGRFSNGASFNFTSRDVNSGTRNVAANNTGVDPSFAVGVNDGGTGATGETLIGGLKFSNKTTGGNLRSTVQNNRFAVGTLSLGDALTATQGGSTPLRGLAYSDSAADSTPVIASAQTIVDGTYAIWQNETYVTIKSPNAQYTNTAGADILGDPNGNVKAIRNNVINSAKLFIVSNTNNTFAPADALINNAFIPESLVQKSKTVDGIGTAVVNPAYDSSNSANFLGSVFINKFAAGDPTTINQGSSSKYATNLATGTNAVNITANNFLGGNFNQTGTRDFASLKNAVTLLGTLEGLAAGTSATSIVVTNGSISNGQTIATVNGNALTKGDLIVMGDVDGRGKFDGRSLYLLATGATLTDNTSTDNLTVTTTLGDAIRGGVLRKNDALDYLQANATAQMKLEAAVGGAASNSANAFNKFDVNRDGRVSRNDAAIVDKFVGASLSDVATQIGATIAIDGSAHTGTNVQKSINLYNVNLVDGHSTIATGKYNGNVITTPGSFASIRLALGAQLQAGDTQFRGSVNSDDINQIVSRGHYDDNTSTNKWSDGDFTGDGLVNSDDINAIVSAGVYDAGNYDNAANLPRPSATLTGRSVRPAVTTQGPVAGQPYYLYDAVTGDVKLVINGFSASNGKKISALTLRSASGQFITGVGYTSANNSGVDSDLASKQFAFKGASTGFGTTIFDLGDILNSNLTASSLLADLTLSYNYTGSGATGDGIDASLVAVPEPTTLSLLGIGAAGLLARRRRKIAAK